MGCRNPKDCIIDLGDLVVVVFPKDDWKWQRYKVGDMGIVLRVMHYKDYSVGQVRLIRTEKIETIPLDYMKKLGCINESRRFSDDK